jgi:hypothetical protein
MTTHPLATHPIDGARIARITLVIVAVAGLAIDAYTHLDLAGNYDPIMTSTLSQGNLFRAEAAIAIVAAVALLVRPRRYTAGLAFLVAAGGLAALLVYRYADFGSLGPIPAMYEPIWYTEKSWTAIAQVVATLASAALILIPFRRDSATTAWL